MNYKKEIKKIMQELNVLSVASDRKRDKEDDNDSFFYQTGKSAGLRMAIMKLNNLINKK